MYLYIYTYALDPPAYCACVSVYVCESIACMHICTYARMCACI